MHKPPQWRTKTFINQTDAEYHIDIPDAGNNENPLEYCSGRHANATPARVQLQQQEPQQFFRQQDSVQHGPSPFVDAAACNVVMNGTVLKRKTIGITAAV